MTSYHIQPLHFKDNINYSYVNRVTVDETDHVDFIYQFTNINTQKNDNFSTFVNYKITEPPIKFTKYEDFKKKISGPLKHTASDNTPQNNIMVDRDITPCTLTKCINIEFYEACYPIRMSLYYPDDHLDSINNEIPCDRFKRIWAQKSDDQWFSVTARISETRGTWQINLKEFQLNQIVNYELSCHFKTKKMKFELRSLPDYSMNIEVILIGTSEFILPRNPKQSLTSLLNNVSYRTKFYKEPNSDILQLQEDFNKHCIICKSDIMKSFYKSKLGITQLQQITREAILIRVPIFRHNMHMHSFLRSLENYSRFKKCVKAVRSYSNESKERSSYNFSALSDEVILQILKNLDVTSLSRMSRVNKRFNNLSRDPLLYKYLNLRNMHFTYMHTNLCQLFDYFAPRCKHLRQLDLSLCKFSTSKFREFLKTCCRRLTHLTLSECYDVNSKLHDISEICKNLKELDLNGCDDITNENISYLKNLQFLESLYLSKVEAIKTNTLCEILQKNRHMRKLNLRHTRLNIDAIATELKNSCPNLERLNLEGCTLTPQSIDALADCKNLREVNFCLCKLIGRINDDIFVKLFSSCQYLETINLKFFKSLTKRDNETLTLCKNLKSLNLSCVNSVTPDICSQLFEKCPKLNKLDLSFCDNITKEMVDKWNEKIYNVIVFTHDF